MRRSHERRRRSRPGAPWRRPIVPGCCGAWRRSSRSTARSWRGSSRATSASRSRARAARSGMVAQVFHFYAGAVDKHYGETIPVAGGDGVHVPRAARRRRPDRALELPAQHRLLEARAGARDREHRRPEAGRADAALGLAARGARARGGDPGGRDQRRRRQGLDRRHAPRRAPGRGEDRLHRLDRGRPAGDERSGGHDQARHARARRQVRQRRLRRRRPGAGCGVGAVCRLRQRRPGLLRALAHPRRAKRLRPLRRAARSTRRRR